MPNSKLDHQDEIDRTCRRIDGTIDGEKLRSYLAAHARDMDPVSWYAMHGQLVYKLEFDTAFKLRAAQAREDFMRGLL
jgi:hypothetical protein